MREADEASTELSPETLLLGDIPAHHQALRRAVEALGDRDRAVVDMRFGFADGRARSTEDIAAWFDVSVEEAESMERRALIRLRTALLD